MLASRAILNHDPDFSSAEYCRRVARGISRTAFSAASEYSSAFDLIAAPSRLREVQHALSSSMMPFCLTCADGEHSLTPRAPTGSLLDKSSACRKRAVASRLA